MLLCFCNCHLSITNQNKIAHGKVAFFITTGNFERVKASWNIHEVEVLFRKRTMSDFLRITVGSHWCPLPFSVSLDIVRFLYAKIL